MNDCIIIGGGVIGMLSARELALSGLRVLLLERGETGREASWAGGGILSPLYPWHYHEAINRLALLSAPAYRALTAHLIGHGHGDPELTDSGLLFIDEAEIAPGSRWASSHSVRHEVWKQERLAAEEPALAPCFTSGLALPYVGQIRNPRLLKALRHELTQLGVGVRENAEVDRIAITSNRVSGVALKHGDERLDAPQVVVAAGSWSAPLAAPSGLDLPIAPVKGQILLYQSKPNLLRHVVLQGGRYLIPRRDGLILAGSTTEQVGYDPTPTPEAATELRRWAETVLPPLAGTPIVKHWAGLRPGSPEGVPTIGEHPGVNGLFINSGHYRNGICTAPASARLLADLMSGRPPIVDPAPYRP